MNWSWLWWLLPIGVVIVGIEILMPRFFKALWEALLPNIIAILGIIFLIFLFVFGILKATGVW